LVADHAVLPATGFASNAAADIQRERRLSRRAFAVALLCHGSISADSVGGFDRLRSEDDRLNAAAFSCTIRAYSAGEHVPRAIIKVR
jgi:hypothetical protein